MERITQLYRIELREGKDWRKLVEAICSNKDHVSLYHLFLAHSTNGVAWAPFHPGLVFEQCRIEPIRIDEREIGFRLLVKGIHSGDVIFCLDAYYDGEGLLIIPCPSF